MQGVVTSTATSIASNLTTAIATSVAMVALSWRLSLLSLVVIPPAVWMTRRVALHPPRGHRAPAGPPRRPQRPDRGGPVGLGRAPVQDPRRRPPSRRALRHDLRGARRPRAAVAAGRPVAHGDDADHLLGDPRPHLPRGRASRDLRRHDDRNPHRLHHPAGRHLPPAHGSAQRRRPVGVLDGPVLKGLRVPRPHPRRRRPRCSRRARHRAGAWRGALRERLLRVCR